MTAAARPAVDEGTARGPEPRPDAAELTRALVSSGVDTVLLAVVDPAGVTRVKAIPVEGLPAAAAAGAGFSRALTVMCVHDRPAVVPGLPAPIGDLRILPDLARGTTLALMPGVAWFPADQNDQDGSAWPACPRRFLHRMMAELAVRGLHLRVGYEFEWFQGSRGGPGVPPVPAHQGPGYSAIAFGYDDSPLVLLRALYRQQVPVAQFHPELAPGQYELSTAPLDASAAADLHLLVRETIREAARCQGHEASFAPVVTAGGIGNGGHIHLSLWREDDNLFAGGTGPAGLTPTGEGFLAGVLHALPALTAISAPSPLSYLRLRPQRWAGALRAWGVENREVALRFVPGTPPGRAAGANVEFKPADGAANPYLALGALIAAGLDGIEQGRTLPEPVAVDPGALSDADRRAAGIEALPSTLDEATDALAADDMLCRALGPVLAETFLATRRAEADVFRDATAEELTEALRWRY